MNEVSRLNGTAIIFFTVAGVGGAKKNGLVCPGQKSFHRIQNLFDKLSRINAAVVNLFVSTFATAEACLEPSRHRGFADSKVDLECFTACREALFKTYVRHVMKYESDLLSSDEMVECMHDGASSSGRIASKEAVGIVEVA